MSLKHFACQILVQHEVWNILNAFSLCYCFSAEIKWELLTFSPPPQPTFTSSRMYSSVLSWISIVVHSHPSVELAVMKTEEEWSCAYLELMSWASVDRNHTKMRSPSSMRLWDRKITVCTLTLQAVIILLTRKCWKWPARLCHLCSRICWNFPCPYALTLQQFKLFSRLVQEMLRWCAECFTKAQEGVSCGRKHLRV